MLFALALLLGAGIVSAFAQSVDVSQMNGLLAHLSRGSQ